MSTNTQIQNNEKSAITARLNDAFRKHFIGGLVCLSSGVQSLDERTYAKLIKAVQAFDEFTKDNDPYGEHDFGKVNIDGQWYFWKIDYYDSTLEMLSPDKSDPNVTKRVLTIMQADEY